MYYQRQQIQGGLKNSGFTYILEGEQSVLEISSQIELRFIR